MRCFPAASDSIRYPSPDDATPRINPSTMGYISVVIPSVKVNRAEEGIGNPEYSLLWLQKNQKSQIGIGSLYPMTYSNDGIYVPSKKSQVSTACDLD